MARSTFQGKTRTQPRIYLISNIILHVTPGSDTKTTWCTRPSKVKLEISQFEIIKKALSRLYLRKTERERPRRGLHTMFYLSY